MKFKPYENREYLFQEYVVRKKTAKQIADDNDVTEMTIYNHLKKQDLLRLRGKGRQLGRRSYGPNTY